MKRLLLLLPAFAAVFMLESCIQDEPLNAECDITGIDSVWLSLNKSILRTEPQVSNNRVVFTLNDGVDRTALAPKFTLTEGATITATADGGTVAANGITRDFSSPQVYTVHSQDGNWSKDYEVSFSPVKPIGLLDFENYDLSVNADSARRYQQWYEVDSTDTTDPIRRYWSSGNAGYAFTGMAHAPSDYPTTVLAEGYQGKGVKLTTCATGSYGEAVHMPIAAGSLFIGEFKSSQAMLAPRKATRFGLPLVNDRPVRFEGYYKYQTGEVFTDKNKNVCPERHDTADIYAVVYEIATTDEREAGKKVETLNGDDVLSSDRIVLIARIDAPKEIDRSADIYASPWEHFSEDFKLIDGKTFSEERLRKQGYAITVVATSSRQGAYFEGSIGSTLFVDALRIVWAGEE